MGAARATTRPSGSGKRFVPLLVEPSFDPAYPELAWQLLYADGSVADLEPGDFFRLTVIGPDGEVLLEDWPVFDRVWTPTFELPEQFEVRVELDSTGLEARSSVRRSGS